MPLSDVVIDTSAVIAILAQEDGADQLIASATAASRLWISAVSTFESAMVATRFTNDDPFEAVRLVLKSIGAEIVSVDEQTALFASDAFLRFGKGRHRAALNFGDCFVYALARTASASVLCVGEDFAQTDLSLAT